MKIKLNVRVFKSLPVYKLESKKSWFRKFLFKEKAKEYILDRYEKDYKSEKVFSKIINVPYRYVAPENIYVNEPPFQESEFCLLIKDTKIPDYWLSVYLVEDDDESYNKRIEKFQSLKWTLEEKENVNT